MGVANVNSFAGTAPQQRDTLQTVMQSQKRAGKVNNLVVMLKSLALTGCGDAFAVVKDPSTASMGAGIDQEVLQSYPRLDPGAVLVLDNVSYLFMATVPYLCVTMANVRKVVPPEAST
ncbi:g1286 [Coccomyxa elongata]